MDGSHDIKRSDASFLSVCVFLWGQQHFHEHKPVGILPWGCRRGDAGLCPGLAAYNKMPLARQHVVIEFAVCLVAEQTELLWPRLTASCGIGDSFQWPAQPHSAAARILHWCRMFLR